MRWMLTIRVVSFHWHCDDLGGHGVTMEVIDGSRGTPQSVVRSCRMDVTSSLALDMCENLHLIIS